MSKQNDLTNEKLGKEYGNSFELVNHAIKVAHRLILSSQVDTFGSGGNQVYNVLKQVLKEKMQEPTDSVKTENTDKEISNKEVE